MSWGPPELPVSREGLRSLHRLRSEKPYCEAEGRGFDSPHLHRVLKTFPQVSEGVICGGGAQRARKGRGATPACFGKRFSDPLCGHRE